MEDENEGEAKESQVRRDKSRAEFIANIGHDLKTYLNPIVGFASVLLQDDEGLEREQRNQIELIAESARRLLHRLDALVEFQRIQAGTARASMDWFSPQALLSELVASYADRAKARKTELRHAPGAPPKRIRSDYRMVLRVVDELLANAVKAAGQGVVSLEVNHQAADKEGHTKVEFRVQDSGAGLDADDQERLRKSLAGPSGKSAKGWEGLGLGLALSREVARELGATIEVQSIPGVGCTFKLQMEFAAKDAEL